MAKPASVYAPACLLGSAAEACYVFDLTIGAALFGHPELYNILVDEIADYKTETKK